MIHAGPVRGRARWRARSAFAALAIGALATLATAARGGELLDMLRPGSCPATGLTGDPFRSPFTDGLSWAGPVLDGRRSVRAEAVSSQAWNGRGLPADLRNSRVDWIATGSPPVPGPPWAMAVRLARPAFEVAWNGEANGVRMDGAGEALDLAVQPPAILDRARVRAAFPLAGGDGTTRPPASVELAWLGSSRLALQGGASWSRTPDRLRSSVEGEDFDASLNFGTRRYQGDLWAEVRPGLALEGSVSDAEVSPLAGRSGKLVYELETAGRSRMLRAGVQWRAPRGSRLLLRRSDLSARFETDASWGGERFGHLNYAHVDAQSWLGAIECPLRRGRAILDFESARGRFQARAEVESWPFTDALADLLGARRIARGAGALRWEVTHAAVEREVRRGARMRLGLAWYDLRPEAAIESWRPLFLVFGRTDEERHELDVRRVQLGELGLGADLRLGGFELGVDARQVVFAKVRKSSKPDPGLSEDPEPGNRAAPAGRSRTLAGSRMQVRIERRF